MLKGGDSMKKIDKLTENLIIALYLVEGKSIRQIVKEIEIKTGKQITHTAVYKVLKKYKQNSIDEIFEKLSQLIEGLCDKQKNETSKKVVLYHFFDYFIQQKLQELPYMYSSKIIENENVKVKTFKLDELQKILQLPTICSVFYDDNTNEVLFIFKEFEKRKGDTYE